jgi:hypothetical protein
VIIPFMKFPPHLDCFLVGLGFKLWLCTCKAGAVPPELHLQSGFVLFPLVILEMGGSQELFSWSSIELLSSQSQPPK